MFVINTSLGEIDCSGCQIFIKGPTLYAKRIEKPEFVVLPIKIAEMPNIATAEKALRRIRHAIKTQEHYVDLTDFE